MCGIAGFCDFNCHSEEPALRSMTGVLRHRGPDDSGYYLDKQDGFYLGLGHRRLSILDLSPLGHQPMFFQHTGIVYNGEVYNFREIRQELEKKGYTFESGTDTEVIVKAYHCWGMDMLHKFNGMFAFALYDKKAQKLILVRDRAGVKPLYWYYKDGIFLFASELKSFHQHPGFKKELNNDGLTLFLQYGYIPQPHCIFNDCYKLKGGHYLTLDLKTRQIDDTQYWDVMDCYRQPKLRISEEEAIEETERLLKSAFEYRMVADVPVGMFLSGGIDSSVVTAILQAGRTEKLKTFTIGFSEEKYNEAHHAKKIAGYLGTDHTEYYCSQKDALDILPRLPEIWDEPFGDPSAIPTVLVSRLARQRVTVSLSADGGDETFGGYEKYTLAGRGRKYHAMLPAPLRSMTALVLKNKALHHILERRRMYHSKTRFNRISLVLDSQAEDILRVLSLCYLPAELHAVLLREPRKIKTEFDDHLNQHFVDDLLAIDYKTYQLDDILVKVDRAAMSVSLEGREPLLDYRIIEFVSRLDPSLKIRNGEKKYLLKQIAYRYVPQSLLDRPKAGFAVPINEWFKDKLREFFLCYLSEDRLNREGIFNAREVVRLRDSYFAGKAAVAKLWLLLIFEMWKERWR